MVIPLGVMPHDGSELVGFDVQMQGRDKREQRGGARPARSTGELDYLGCRADVLSLDPHSLTEVLETIPGPCGPSQCGTAPEWSAAADFTGFAA